MANPHILYIDNDFDSKKRAIIKLYSNDMEVLPVSNIKEALIILRNFQTDLIICDMHLADGDAAHLIQTVKASNTFNRIPIIVVSTHLDEMERQQVLRMGASAHLLKDDEEFIQIVKDTATIHGKDYQETSMGISGQLATMKIVDLISHLAEEEGSGAITIDGPNVMEIHLREGFIVHARHGITVGKKALFRCLRIAEAAFHFKNYDSGVEATIENTELAILLEEARISNEKLMANSHKLPNSSYRVRVLQSENLQKTNLKAEARAALEIFKKYPRIGAYLDRLNLPDILCYEYLITFVEKGYIELVTERKPVRVLTDTCCDLTDSELAELNIARLPLTLNISGEKFGDQPRDLGPLYAKKYKHLEQGKILLPEEPFIEKTYRDLVPKHDCLTILSGATPLFDKVQTLQTKIIEDGLNGKSLLANELTTLNSHSNALGLSIITRYAARLAAKGMHIELIEERLLQAMAKLHFFVAVAPERSFLVKKGNAPVILSWESDHFQIVQRLAKGEPVAPALVGEVSRRLDRKSKLHVAVGHIRSLKSADALRQAMMQQLGLSKLPIKEIGPLTGYQLGEGAIGVAFFQE